MVNEDPTEKLIADLKAENERLKNMIKSGKIDPSVLDSSAAAGGNGSYHFRQILSQHFAFSFFLLVFS